MMKVLFAFFSLLITTAASFARVEIRSFLPDTLDFKELTIVQQPSVYNGNELFNMIDGGAEIYLEFGFSRAVNVIYLSEKEDRIEIQLYQMRDTPAAFGILTHSRSNRDSIVDIGCLAIINPYYIMFQKGMYFGIISWTKSTGNEKIHTALAKNIIDKIEASSDMPDLALKAINAGFNVNQLKYIRGNIALSSNYFFSHKDLFTIENALCIKEGDVKYFVFAYTSSEKPLKQLGLIRDEFSGSSMISGYSENEQQASYTDRKNRKISFSLTGNYLFVSVVPENRKANWNKILEIYH